MMMKKFISLSYENVVMKKEEKEKECKKNKGRVRIVGWGLVCGCEWRKGSVYLRLKGASRHLKIIFYQDFWWFFRFYLGKIMKFICLFCIVLLWGHWICSLIMFGVRITQVSPLELMSGTLSLRFGFSKFIVLFVRLPVAFHFKETFQFFLLMTFLINCQVLIFDN